MSDSEHIEIRTTTSLLYELSPEQIAQAFMSMDSGDQAEFFVECARVQSLWVKEAKAKNPAGFCEPAMQWFDVRRELKDREYEEHSGWDFVMDLAAPFYNHFEPGWLGD